MFSRRSLFALLGGVIVARPQLPVTGVHVSAPPILVAAGPLVGGKLVQDSIALHTITNPPRSPVGLPAGSLWLDSKGILRFIP